MLLSRLLRPLWIALRKVVDRVDARFKDWTRPTPYTLIEASAADLLRTKLELLAENALLRQQLIVLERQVKHPPSRGWSAVCWWCWPAASPIGN
jgi:hypothetical protein